MICRPSGFFAADAQQLCLQHTTEVLWRSNPRDLVGPFAKLPRFSTPQQRVVYWSRFYKLGRGFL